MSIVIKQIIIKYCNYAKKRNKEREELLNKGRSLLDKKKQGKIRVLSMTMKYVLFIEVW